MTKIYNRHSEKGKRRSLRQSMPKAEIILWRCFKDKQLQGLKFRRQYSIGKYVVDFYCPKIKLAIEIDGPSHFTEQADEYDKERQVYIRLFGINFLRFTNLDIYKNIDGVFEKINDYLKDFKLPR